MRKNKPKRKQKHTATDINNVKKDKEAIEPSELTEIEELDDLSPVCTVNTYTAEDDGFPHVSKRAIDLLATPTIKYILLDRNLCIKHINPIVHEMFKRYYTLENKPFFNIFGKAIPSAELYELLNHLKNPASGFSWTGILIHKTKYYKTMYTKTHIFPLFKDGELSGYWTIFEDITDSYFKHYKDMLNSLLHASKLKDNDTGFHNERLNYYSRVLTKALLKANLFQQVDADFIENISSLAQIHDIGKIGTPDYILQKKGPLTPGEWKVMREHTINGTLIVSTYPIKMAKEITLSHHEKWDGKGYPYGLAGDMIPLSARIVAVADVYDALRMKRSYKDGITHKETVAHILKDSGTHFDPKIIEIFTTVSDEFNKIWEENKDKTKN